MGRPWTREEAESFVTSLDGVLLVMVVLFVVAMLVIALTDVDSTPKDSQGVPCTISTAQNADGTPECQ